MKLIPLALAALLLTTSAVHAQEPTQAQKDQWARESEERLHTDWGYIARYRADRAFIGVDGISLKNGLSANSETEAATALAMARQSARTYLLCDSSKLERDKYLSFAPLTLFDVLITDREAPPDVISTYRQAGVTVYNG